MATIRKRGRRWRVQVRKAGAAPQSSSWPTRAAAERWARRLEADIDDGKARTGRAATGTVAELLERYEREVGGPAGFGRSKTSSLRMIARGLGTTRLRDLSAEHVIRFARQRHQAGAGKVTVGVDLSYLGTVLRTARALWRLSIDDAPVREARQALRMVNLVGRSRSRTRRPTPAELEALFAFWRGNDRMQLPMPDLVEFAIASAMRLGEVCRIARADLDPAARTVLIRDRKDPRAKAGNDQLVPLLDVSGYDALAIAMRQPASADGRIFPYAAASVGTAFARACERLEIEDLQLRDLRHEGCSRLFEAGLQVPQVALISGHKRWETLRIYTQLRPRDVTAAWPPRSTPATP